MGKPILGISVLFGLILYSHSVFCGTPVPRGEVVIPPAALTAAPALRQTPVMGIPYGKNTIGFAPAGDEIEARGPSWFTVTQEGSFLVADPVHNRIVELVHRKHLSPRVTIAGKLPRAATMREPLSLGRVSAQMLGAESFAVDFQAAPPSRIRIEWSAPLASIDLIGVDTQGQAFVLVEHYRQLGKLAVNRAIIVVTRSGQIKGFTSIEGIPSIPLHKEFQLGPDNALYRMIPGTEAVRFVRMELAP